MRIVLVNPPPASQLHRHWAEYPLLGLAYVAASLRTRGHEVYVVDGKLEPLDVQAITSLAVALGPDLVGITAMTIDLPRAIAIAASIKQQSDVPIVVGGAHVNGFGGRVLDESDAFDFACVGEGEYLVCELVDALDGKKELGEINGLAWRTPDGKIETNEKRAYPKDYDALPFPAWDLFRVGDHLPIITHRGCPFQCVFCAHNSGFRPRYRSPSNVLDELDYVVGRFKPKVVRFEDETFGLNMSRTKRMLRGIVDRGLNERVAFSAQTRVDKVDEEFIDLLVRANFETLEVGVESGNAEVLRRIKKGITLPQVERAVRLAKSRGLRVWCKFILGHPGETMGTMRDTADFIAKINPDRLSVALMTPYPGTPIFYMAMSGQGGYRMLTKDWDDFDKYSAGALELENISLGQLRRYQLWSYLKLYLSNGRVADLLRLGWSHRRVTTDMLVMAARETVREAASRLRGELGEYARE